MNPSNRGWIAKLIKLVETNTATKLVSIQDLYIKLKDTGFLYGSNVLVVDLIVTNPDYIEEERCKLNLLTGFYIMHKTSKSVLPFENSLLSFYKTIQYHKPTLLSGLIGEHLETVIHRRVQIETNLITKNFSFFATNALLFIDILAYDYFLKNESDTMDYIKHLENSVRTLIITALNSKAKRNSYDESLIKLLEASLRFSKDNQYTYDKVIESINSNIEAQYLMDIACLATWSDLKIKASEQHFTSQLGKDLELTEQESKDAMRKVVEFYSLYKDKIALLSSKNIVQSFYDNSSQIVSKLITRNSKRLYRELKESKDLVWLLSQSTVRDLDKNEQKQVQEQLMDILKSIPSLAIFMLPGGAVLLPLFIKFIPKLLPSAFDDNRIEK
jgi:hypothetical protein